MFLWVWLYTQLPGLTALAEALCFPVAFVLLLALLPGLACVALRLFGVPLGAFLAAHQTVCKLE